MKRPDHCAGQGQPSGDKEGGVTMQAPHGARSFAAHMLEHEMMMLLAAPLLVLAEPLAIMLWAFPAGGRQTVGASTKAAPIRRFLTIATDPVVATIAQAGALWLWHAPGLFDLALASPGWHGLKTG